MPYEKKTETAPAEIIGNFSINDVAKHLGVHRSTVERLLHSGAFGKDWWRIGIKIIIPKKNVFEYEQRQKEQALGRIAA